MGDLNPTIAFIQNHPTLLKDRDAIIASVCKRPHFRNAPRLLSSSPRYTQPSFLGIRVLSEDSCDCVHAKEDDSRTSSQPIALSLILSWCISSFSCEVECCFVYRTAAGWAFEIGSTSKVTICQLRLKAIVWRLLVGGLRGPKPLAGLGNLAPQNPLYPQ